MIISPEDFQKVVKLLMELNQAYEIALKELIEKKISEALEKHLDEYEHTEKAMLEEEMTE
jgi:hypothetical protein